MNTNWDKIFDNFGIKQVSRTDKKKNAYVPNKNQRTSIESAGVVPSTIRPAPEFNIVVLHDASFKSVKASYYYSERSLAANRSPEPRMGHEFISRWLNVDDKIVIGNIGSEIFAFKEALALGSDEGVTAEILRLANRETIFARANKAAGKPALRVLQRNDFVRNPYVVSAALFRANGVCEMPGCSSTLFERDDGVLYLEVHHIEPLGEGGEDTLKNAAAICPHCHREQHFGKMRLAKRNILRDHIHKICS
jgi:hypothetical protein